MRYFIYTLLLLFLLVDIFNCCDLRYGDRLPVSLDMWEWTDGKLLVTWWG